MTQSSARWQLERLSPEAREAAELTAQREGMPLAGWLAKLIVETSAIENVALPAERPRDAAAREPGLSVVPIAAPSPLLHQHAPTLPSLFKQTPTFRTPPRPTIASQILAEPSIEGAAPIAPLNPFARLATPAGARPTDASHPVAAPTPAAALDALDLARSAADEIKVVEPAISAPVVPATSPPTASPPAAPPAAAPSAVAIPVMPASPVHGDGIVTLPVDALVPSGCGTRRNDDAPPSDLVMSIATEGLREPLLVRPAQGGNGYEIVAGLRRWRAAQRIGLTHVPAMVADLDDGRALLASLKENIAQDDLPALDEAGAYLRLMTQHGLGAAEVTAATGRDRQHVVRWMRLLGLPPRVREHLDAGRLTTDHAFLLLGAPDAEAVGDAIAAEGLSLDETRRRLAATSATERPA